MDSTFKSLYEAVTLTEGRETVTIELKTEDEDTTVLTVRTGNFERTDTLVRPPAPQTPEEFVRAQMQPDPAEVMNAIVSDLLSAYATFYVRPNDPGAAEFINSLPEEASA